MNDNANNRGAQDASVKHVPVLKDVEDMSVRIIIGLGALDGLVEVRIELLAGGVYAFHTVTRECVPELFANQRYTLTVFFVSRIVVCLQRSIESVEDGYQIHD